MILSFLLKEALVDHHTYYFGWDSSNFWVSRSAFASGSNKTSSGKIRRCQIIQIEPDVLTGVSFEKCGWGIFPSHTHTITAARVAAHYDFSRWYVGRACRCKTKPRREYIERLSRVGPTTPT